MNNQITRPYAFLAALVGQTFVLSMLVSFSFDLPDVLSWAIVLYTKDLNASISSQAELTSPGMLFSMKMFFLSPSFTLMPAPNFALKFSFFLHKPGVYLYLALWLISLLLTL